MRRADLRHLYLVGTDLGRADPMRCKFGCDAAERSPAPIAALRWQVDQMSEVLGLDPARVARWAFAKSVGEEFGPSKARLLRALMVD